MEIEEARKRIGVLEKGLGIAEKQQELVELNKKMNAEGFWNDQKMAQRVSQRASGLDKLVTNFGAIKRSVDALAELIAWPMKRKNKNLSAKWKN